MNCRVSLLMMFRRMCLGSQTVSERSKNGLHFNQAMDKLTVAAANSLLKTVNFCLDKKMLRVEGQCDEDSESHIIQFKNIRPFLLLN